VENFINREEFFPYGETSFGAFAKKRYRFIGKAQDDESGMSYFGFRYYVSWLGKWASCDSIHSREKTSENQRVLNNLYWYADDNPLRYIDNDGEKAIDFAVYMNASVVDDKKFSKLSHDLANSYEKKEGAIPFEIWSFKGLIRQLTKRVPIGHTLGTLTIIVHGVEDKKTGAFLGIDLPSGYAGEDVLDKDAIRTVAQKLGTELLRLQWNSTSSTTIRLISCEVGMNKKFLTAFASFFGNDVTIEAFKLVARIENGNLYLITDKGLISAESPGAEGYITRVKGGRASRPFNEPSVKPKQDVWFEMPSPQLTVPEQKSPR
jgi:RHS repeat-associated protein